MFVLDSDHLSILQQQSRREFDVLQSKLNLQRPADIATTIIAFQEQLEGWFTYLKKARDADGILWAYDRMLLALEYFCKSKRFRIIRTLRGNSTISGGTALRLEQWTFESRAFVWPAVRLS